MTNIDNTLLNAAKITGDHADLYGEHVAFYDKAAALATIKLGRPISGRPLAISPNMRGNYNGIQWLD